MTSQIDLFGNDVPLGEIAKKENKSIRRLFRKMYGFNHNHTCKDCKYLVYNERDRRWYKCLIMGVSASEATDVHLKDIACGKWERKEE